MTGNAEQIWQWNGVLGAKWVAEQESLDAQLAPMSQLLAEAASRLGPWAASPRFTWPHRWRLARVERGTELRQPLRLTLSGGQRLGVAGEVFAPGGGVQAAWLSGMRLAERLLKEPR
jgi:predicted NAD/FAD-dependent oxidoreductase